MDAIALHQATEPSRFFSEPLAPSHELLFVANSRKVHRRIIDDLGATDRDLAVYGRHWTADLIDPRYVLGENIPNRVLRRYYSAAKIVLNDHWPNMAAGGFFSNRIYDALASGTVVVTDDVAGLDAEFDGGAVAYANRDDLLAIIDRLLADPEERAARAAAGRAAVLERHTFAQRAEVLLAHVLPALKTRPAQIAGTGADPPEPAGAALGATEEARAYG